MSAPIVTLRVSTPTIMLDLARNEALKRNIHVNPDIMNYGMYFNVVSQRITIIVEDGIIRRVDIEPEKVWYSDSEGKPHLHFVMFCVSSEDVANPIPHCELIIEDPEHLPEGITLAMCRFTVKDGLVGSLVYKTFEFVEVYDRLHLLHESIVEGNHNLDHINREIQKCVDGIMSDVVTGETFTPLMKKLRVEYVRLVGERTALIHEIARLESDAKHIYGR